MEVSPWRCPWALHSLEVSSWKCPQALGVSAGHHLAGQGAGPGEKEQKGAAPQGAEDADQEISSGKHIPAVGSRGSSTGWDTSPHLQQSCSCSPPALALGQGFTAFELKFCNLQRLCGAGTPPNLGRVPQSGWLEVSGLSWVCCAARGWIPAVASNPPPGSRSWWIPGAGCAWRSSLPPLLQS